MKQLYSIKCSINLKPVMSSSKTWAKDAWNIIHFVALWNKMKIQKWTHEIDLDSKVGTYDILSMICCN